MAEHRRVGTERDGYLTEAEVREQLGTELEDQPTAAAALLATLAAMDAAGTGIGVTTATAPYAGGVAVGGYWIDGPTRTLTVNHAGEDHDHYPRRRLTLAQAGTALDPADPDRAALAAVLRAIEEADPQVLVEALAPAHWTAEALLRLPGGELVTLAVEEHH